MNKLSLERVYVVTVVDGASYCSTLMIPTGQVANMSITSQVNYLLMENMQRREQELGHARYSQRYRVGNRRGVVGSFPVQVGH